MNKSIEEKRNKIIEYNKIIKGQENLKKLIKNNIMNKLKTNNPLKIPHKNSYHRPQMNFLGDITTDKNIYSPSYFNLPFL